MPPSMRSKVRRSEHMQTREIFKEKQINIENGSLDGFLISPKLIQEMTYYFCEFRGWDSENFSARYKLARTINQHLQRTDIICEGEYIVSLVPIPNDIISQHKLTLVTSPNNSKVISASNKLMLNNFMNGYSRGGFRLTKGSVKSINPIEEKDVFQQYLEYRPVILNLGDRFILRPNPKCVYERTDNFLDMCSRGEIPKLGTEWRYKYQQGTCVLRKITDRKITDKLDETGITLLDWYEKESLSKPRLRPFLQKMRNNPDMPVLEVDHDFYNQGKNKRKFSIAAVLLSKAINLDDIPNEYRRIFMKNSHINMDKRMERCIDFLDGIKSESINNLIPTPVSPRIAGLSSLVIKDNNLEFGDGKTTNKWDPKSNFMSLIKHGPFRLPQGKKKIGIVPFRNKNSQFEKVIKETFSYLKKMNCDIEWQFLNPWDIDIRNRASEFELQDNYSESDCDALIVELEKYSKQNWNAWKRALVPSKTPSQMITNEKLSVNGAAFNLALGLISALGGLSYGISDTHTGIQVWIGMDSWREGRKNISAASVACDANGLLIGYPHPVVTAGERTDDRMFEEQLRITIEGTLHHYKQLGCEKPQKFALIRDGRFFENKNIIYLMEKEYGINFIVCDVQKMGSPKLSILSNNGYISAEGGTILWNQKKGYIQTTEQRSGSNTGTPKLISIGLHKGNVKMDDLLKDLFWLSNIHSGSTQQPGIPMPQYIAHIIAQQAGQGMSFNHGFYTDLGIL